MPSPKAQQKSKRGAAAQAAAAAAVASKEDLARTAGERSPLQKDLQPADKAPRGADATVSAAKGLFKAPLVAPAAPAATPAARVEPQQIDDELVDRVFSTPSGGNAKVPSRFTGDDIFGYKAGYTAGVSGEKFLGAYNPEFFGATRHAFHDGWVAGYTVCTAMKDGMVDTPELREVRTPRNSG